jgi:hypothetical protein
MVGPEKQIILAVGEHLRTQNPAWDQHPEQGVFNREIILDRATAIHQAVTDVAGNSSYLYVDKALDDTHNFINNNFDVYEGKKESEKFGWVFAVPGRIGENQGDEYASEVTPFLPILDPKYGVDDRTRQHTTARLAPGVIETYNALNNDEEKGAIVWTPFYVDSMQQRDPISRREFLRKSTPGIRENVRDTAAFVRNRLGAQVMGLGASIPSFTQLGKAINQEGLITTTGHAGTVYLINETVRDVSERMGLANKTIGLLGAGSIGSSWAEVLMSQKEGHRLSVYDDDEAQTLRLIRNIDQPDSVDIQKDELAVFETADIIVSAITQSLDLDILEWKLGRKIDLTGKVIIDDSQPGAFDRQQIEDRGGKLVWVVGKDQSIGKTLSRESGYNFGDHAGLYGEGSVWGCEAEAAAIFLRDRKDLAVLGHVNPEMVIAVGALCREIGVGVARPLQSFGKPVTF